KVKARNAQGIETDFSEELSAYTGANIPSAPNVTQLSTSSLNVVIAENSNNSAVEYSIQEVGTELFVDISTGELGAESWGTYAQWGGAQGIDVSELESGTQYAFRVKARNSDEVETGYGSSSSAWTA